MSTRTTSAARHGRPASGDPTPPSPSAIGRAAGLLGRLSRGPETPILLLVLLVAGLAITLVWTTFHSQHEIALARSKDLVDTMLARQSRDLDKEVLDYAYWEEAVTNLVESPDPVWADGNIGSHGSDYLGLSVALVVSSEGAPIMAFSDGVQVEPMDLLSRISGGLNRLMDSARAMAAEAPASATGLVAVDGLPHLAAAAVLTLDYGAIDPAAADAQPVLVFLRALDEKLLQQLGSDLTIAHLGFVPPGGATTAASHALLGLGGEPLGWLTWSVKRPDPLVLRQIALPVAIAFAGVLLLALLILRRIIGTSQELNESLALLAERNEELSESERLASEARVRLESALEYSPEAIAFFNSEARLVICNERFRRLMHPAYRHLVAPGQDLETIGKTYAKAWFGSNDEGEGARWLEQLRSGNDGSAEIGMACGRWMLQRERRTADGGFVILFTDITELHGRQKNLTDRSSRLQVTLDTLREGVAVFDPDRRLLVCNRRYVEILGLEKQSLRQGVPFEEILPWFAACRMIDRDGPGRGEVQPPPRCAEDIPNVAEYETPDHNIVKVRRTPAPDGAIVITFRDVTRRRRAEQRLRTAMEQADLANRAKTEFLANVSHELRTPLNAIIGFSEIMKGEMFGVLGNDTYLDYANDIHESGRHLLAVINDILDLSKIESGRAKLNEEVVDVTEVSTSALRIVRERAQAAGIMIGAELPHDLPHLRADSRAIKQILINLLSNAIKFTPANGTVTLLGRMTREGGVELRVEDSGIGIAAKDIPIALAPFGQVDGALSRSVQGTGLGLPLSMALAEEHGGSLRLESAVDVGTTVVVTLPAGRVVQKEALRAGLAS